MFYVFHVCLLANLSWHESLKGLWCDNGVMSLSLRDKSPRGQLIYTHTSTCFSMFIKVVTVAQFVREPIRLAYENSVFES